MKWWPFVWLATLEAAEARAQWAEKELRDTQDRLAIQASMTEQARREAEERREGLHAEIHKLVDRIAEMSGQPPIYEKPAAVVQTAQSDTGPPTAKVITFEDIHAEARKAMANGTFSITKGRLN